MDQHDPSHRPSGHTENILPAESNIFLTKHDHDHDPRICFFMYCMYPDYNTPYSLSWYTHVCTHSTVPHSHSVINFVTDPAYSSSHGLSIPKILCTTHQFYWIQFMLDYQPPSWNANPSDSPTVYEWFRWNGNCGRMHTSPWNKWLEGTNSSLTKPEKKLHSFKLVAMYGCPQRTLETCRAIRNSNTSACRVLDLHLLFVCLLPVHKPAPNSHFCFLICLCF